MADPIDEFLEYGSQYYTAGRYAAFAGLLPVVGTLLHHAVEMLLKGALARSMTLPDMKAQLRHDLPKIWEAFKGLANDPTLVRFDGLITSLNKFEEIRYPDKILTQGAQLHVDITKSGAAMNVASGPHAAMPSYKVCVEEIDELVAVAFRVAGRNPAVFLPHMKEDAKTYVNKDNKHLKV